MSAEMAGLRMSYLRQVAETRQSLRVTDEYAGIVMDHSLYPVLDEGGCVEYIIIFSRDITDQRKAERAVYENEEMLRVLFNAVTESILLTDREGVILMLNETAARRFGKTPAEMTGTRMTDMGEELLPRDLAESRRKHIETVVRTGAAVRFEDVRAGMHLDVNMYPILDERGAVRRIAIFCKDVTERKQLEQRLKESEEKYRTVVESAGETIAIVDEQGVFLFMNGTAGRALGGKPSGFIGKTMWDLFPKEIADRQAAAVLKVIRTGLAHAALAMSYVGGQWRWYGTTIEPLRDSENRVTSALLIARDVHELQTTQRELDAYREKMMRAEQLASLGTLSATLAHELTQPLTVVRLSLQNAMKGLDGIECPATVLEDLGDGLAEISNITAIIERIRNFARKTSGRTVTEVVLAVTARRVMRLLEESARKARVALEVGQLEELPPIQIYEKDIEQVFFSLAQNAIQAADGRKDRCLRVTGTHQDGMVELQFTDDCGGIAPEHRGRLFEPFFTTKRAGEGTGLGLCIVQRIVSQAGGRIRVDSRSGEGTTFFVTLPIEKQ